MSIISVNAGIMLQQLKQADAGMAPPPLAPPRMSLLSTGLTGAMGGWIAGAGVGSALGAGSGLITEALKEKERRNLLRGLLMGGTIGGLGGGAAGAMGGGAAGAGGAALFNYGAAAVSPKPGTPQPLAKAAEAYYAPADRCNAFTAAIRRHEMQKQAELPTWQQFSADPMGEAGKQLTAAGPMGSSLGGAALGGLVGAGLGGASEMMKEKKDRDMLRGLLGGGVLGVGAGGLAGYAANRWAGQPGATSRVPGATPEAGQRPPTLEATPGATSRALSADMFAPGTASLERPSLTDRMDIGYPAGQRPAPKPLFQGAKDMYGQAAQNAGQALGLYNKARSYQNKNLLDPMRSDPDTGGALHDEFDYMLGHPPSRGGLGFQPSNRIPRPDNGI